MLLAAVINILKENKESICDELDGMINVPLVSEQKEEACIKRIFDVVVEVLGKVLSKWKRAAEY